MTQLEAEREIARVVREEAGQLVGSLVRTLGDFALAEDLVQDALVEALEHWPREGLPRRPGAWLLATARRKGIDRARRDARYQHKLTLLHVPHPEAPGHMLDDRLPLLFTCCHPALSREAQIALTLRGVVGLTTAEIAHAFLTSEATVAQRIVRAKRKIVEAGIPFRVPPEHLLAERLDQVLRVVYLTFNEGYLATGPEAAARHDLAADAEWLASLLVRLLPDEPEAAGLLALVRLHQARAAARFDAAGRLVLLEDQDRSRWDRAAIAAASGLLERALALGRPGAYQIQAAIAACHAEASSWEATDWRQIVALYTALLRLSPSPVVALNRAIAVNHVQGPAAALAEVELLASQLETYYLYHATRGKLLRALGRSAEARQADARALQLTRNPAERDLLRRRLLEDASR